MRLDVVGLDIRQRRRSLIGYSAGMAVYTLAVVALFPAFKNSNALDSLIHSDPTAAALFGISGSISSSGGWLNANIYANFFPLLMFLLTIGYGSAAIAGQDEDGTLCLLVALPLSRHALLLQKTVAMVLQAIGLGLAVAVCVVIGRSFQLTTTVGVIAGTSAAVVVMGLDFGLLAISIGAWTGRRGTAIGAASSVAAASYLINSLAPVVSWLHPWRYLSLFYWCVGDNQIITGPTAADFLVLTAVLAVLLLTGVATFRRMPVR